MGFDCKLCKCRYCANESDCKIKSDLYNAGMKEVVDFIKGYDLKILDEYGGYTTLEFNDDWIKKLKDWGIE